MTTYTYDNRRKAGTRHCHVQQCDSPGAEDSEESERMGTSGADSFERLQRTLRSAMCGRKEAAATTAAKAAAEAAATHFRLRCTAQIATRSMTPTH